MSVLYISLKPYPVVNYWVDNNLMISCGHEEWSYSISIPKNGKNLVNLIYNKIHLFVSVISSNQTIYDVKHAVSSYFPIF